MKIFIVMGVGILIGRFLMTGRIKKWNERLAMLCTLLLIFSMGVMLGQKENFLSELSSLGLKSFLFFLIPTLVSIILVYILTKRFMEKKHSDSEGEDKRSFYLHCWPWSWDFFAGFPVSIPRLSAF